MVYLLLKKEILYFCVFNNKVFLPIYLSINLAFIGSLTIKDTLRCKQIEHLCELLFSDVQ